MIFFYVILLLIVTVFLSFPFGIKKAFEEENEKWMNPTEFIGIILFSISWIFIFFYFYFFELSAEYYEVIDPSNQDYTPFSKIYHVPLNAYLIFGVFSMIYLWIKNYKVPPLILILSVLLTTFSGVLFVVMAIQVSYRTGDYFGKSSEYLLTVAYAINAFICFMVAIRFFQKEMELAKQRTYNNKNLDDLNQKIVRTEINWGKYFLFAFPLFLLPMLFLMLFGYEYDAMVKVFTETTTWNFSQETHPPFLEHEGHYLCTVAACGNPKVVKPVRLGERHGNEIIVNRQLMIANAFEEKIEGIAPKFHRWIRKNYDKYGYNLSKKLTTTLWSNVTYILMKPLEFIFWLFLNVTDIEPQKRINRQYLSSK